MAEQDVSLKNANCDCIFYMGSTSKKKCRALNDLYCTKEIRPCRFYKSRYEYDEYGQPKGKRNGTV
jgi:hypothetical protein